MPAIGRFAGASRSWELGRSGFPLVSVMENKKCVEFYESIGQWVFAELRYRDETLDALDGS